MSVRQRVIFGKLCEKNLQQRIEHFLGTTLTPTTATYDKVDYTTREGDLVELKSRPASRNFNVLTPQGPETYKAWFFPVCKTENLEAPLHIFYWYETNNSLWYCKYEDEKFSRYKKTVPFRHRTNQLHYLIPKEHFAEIPIATASFMP